MLRRTRAGLALKLVPPSWRAPREQTRAGCELVAATAQLRRSVLMIRLPYAVDMSTSDLTFDLLSWIDGRTRSYAETIEAWKTSCPQLSVWDDAVIDGLVRVDRRPRQGGLSSSRLAGRRPWQTGAGDLGRAATIRLGAGQPLTRLPGTTARQGLRVRSRVQSASKRAGAGLRRQAASRTSQRRRPA